MDNQTPNSQNDWVDTRLASLAPPRDWHPDSKRALAQFWKRRDSHEAAASPRWIQLSMAAAILVSIGLVVTLLPWHALWSGTKSGKNLTPESQDAAAAGILTGPAPSPTPPVKPQPPAAAAIQKIAKPEPEQEQKLEHFVPGETEPQTISPKSEPEYTDEARRAHIQGTVVQTPVEHVGPGVTPPKVILSGEPNYTDEARQAHIQGTIILSVIIRADGTAKVEKVVRGLGYGLDEKAIEAIEKWRFVPGMKDGKPVDIQLQVTMNFHLY